MEKSSYLQQKKLNPADELREVLSSLEKRLPGVRSMTSTQALILLRDLDQAYQRFETLLTAGVDLLPEQGRFKVVQAGLRKSPSSLLSALGGAAALEAYRPKPPPVRERWWWYLDEMVSRQYKILLQRAGIGLILVLLLIGGGVLAFRTVLAPSPEAVIGFEVEQDANIAIEQGDYQTALAVVEEGLTKLPNDPGFLLYKGVLHEIMGETELAEQAFAEAEVRLNDPLNFYIARSQLHLRLGQPELAEPDARAAIKANETSARAWLLLGQSLQFQGREFEAIPVYEKAGQLALDSGDNEIVVLARLALGQMGAAP